MASITVGTVVGLWRYPVKSMAAEALERAEVGWHGIAGDRRWAFVRNGIVGSGFPWFTLRQRADLCHFRPVFMDPANPDKSPIRIETPEGRGYNLTDPALIEELHADGLQLIKQDRGVFDAFSLSLISTQTVHALGDRLGRDLDPLRFRPNVLVAAGDDTPFQEDTWVGSDLEIGGMRMRVDKRDGRCVVINIDPATGRADADLLRTVATERDNCAGVYGSVAQPGVIQVNDSVRLSR